jgi:putative flippase GtrA
MIFFSLMYNLVLHGHDIPVGSTFHISARVAALFMTFCFNVPFGFVLSSYIVFPESQIQTKIQFIRYTAAAVFFIVLAYLLTKFFAFAIPLVRADVANIFVTMITAVLSYLSQRFYTFKITEVNGVEEETITEEVINL